MVVMEVGGISKTNINRVSCQVDHARDSMEESNPYAVYNVCHVLPMVLVVSLHGLVVCMYLRSETGTSKANQATPQMKSSNHQSFNRTT